MKKNKVFIISLHKTGTTSLTRFFEKLGYLVTGPDTHLFAPMLNNDYEEIDEFLKRFDVFQDDPWYMLYPYLYEKFPNAKFIYLERDEISWIKSVQKFYGRNKYNNAIRRYFYGSSDTISNRDDYLKKYRLHNREVKDFFKLKENFISISISNNKDAIRLQKFIGEHVRLHSFPHKNKAPSTKTEERTKKIKKLFKGGFGLKNFIKTQFKRILGHNEYIKFRTKVRWYRSKIRVFFLKLFNN